MPSITSNIHYKYYIGIGFLILVIIGSYIMLQHKDTEDANPVLKEVTIDQNLISYDFDTPTYSKTNLLSETEKLHKITTLEHRKQLFEADLERYQQLYDKYNNRIIIFNKKKHAEEKDKYAILIQKTNQEIEMINKQLYFLKK